MNAHIEGVRVAGTPEGALPVVLVGVEDESDVLPIFIGFDEATSIARGQDATDIGRPLTHDLLLDTIEELGGRVDRVVVRGVDDGTYLADLHLQTPRGEAVVDARPSDSLALATRTNTPVEVEADVFEDGRRAIEDFEELEDIREVMER
ncbi:bifunctional nuclease family protein [Halobacterium zhouii]|uniref:bifunctional nuclease family protein n=1 Tax=Halobacterium zhouii TaxID=2902624 RepID=UPI001E283DD4|nr:bifunctional nuclease domain-containing protein [Halobacterium zhouii]